MQMNASSIVNQKAEWEKLGVKLPAFDHAAMTAATKEHPIWVHFGAGNIFRGFIAALQQRLLNEGVADRGIIAADTFDYDISESARAASALMKNFNISAEEAYGLIATGAQNGADKNGDLLDTLNEYYSSFGLGEPTGIEIGENTGSQAVNENGQDQAPWAAFGQANQEYTPLQLANYIATLVSGGKHCPAHLLKSVKSYDNSEIIATGSTEPLNTMNISDSTLQAVKKGMLGYTTNGGSVAVPFQNCVVSAGAKTGTAQIGGSMKNGVFVAFAPYDDPEIAVALVLEKADAGAVLASTAVDIINAYFSREDTASIVPENQLIP